MRVVLGLLVVAQPHHPQVVPVDHLPRPDRARHHHHPEVTVAETGMRRRLQLQEEANKARLVPNQPHRYD
jgi:hypothetical protein